MKKVFLTLFVAAFCVLLTSQSACANSGEVRVMVEVVGDQNQVVKRFIEKALEEVGGIINVKTEPEVYIHIITRKLITNKGKRIGYVMTSASAEVLELTLDGGYPYMCSDYSGLWLEVGPDLRDLCNQCVGALNNGILKQARSAESVTP